MVFLGLLILLDGEIDSTIALTAVKEDETIFDISVMALQDIKPDPHASK